MAQSTKMLFNTIFILCLFGIVTRVECACGEGQFSCQTLDGKYGTCVNKTCVVIKAEERLDLRFSVIVNYPESTLMVSLGLFV